MKRSYLNKSQVVRFRQWSRKGYAVFAGLHKNISIGHVSADICEKSLIKSSPFLILKSQGNSIFNRSDDDGSESDFELDRLFLQLVETIQTNNDIAACQQLNKFYKTINQKVDIELKAALYQPF